MAIRAADWYFDADTIGVGRILANAGVRTTWPGDDGKRAGRRDLMPSPIATTNIPDDVWIEQVTRAGMAIITRDQRILTRTSEVNAVIAHRARVFALSAKGDNDLWGLVQLVAIRWRDMERHALTPGPFIMSVTRNKLRHLAP